jgi:osmotically-inducible protein OsmY
MTTWLKAITVALALTGLKVLLASQDATAGLTDDTITARVQQEFRFNVQLRDADIHVSTSQGIVTLKGVVSSYLEQQRARQLCQRINGVEGVVNQLVVKFSPDTPWNAASLLEDKLADDPLLREHALTVDVHHNRVVLGGVVTSGYEKLRAEQIARRLPGVVFVRNEIQVQSSSDESIRSAVFNRLRSDWRINAIWVEVSVEHQIVRLYGYVESPMQKDLAENRVRSLPEVRDVQNHLTVAHSPTSRLSR